MAEEPVNFERITKLYREESGKKSLTPLEPDFWDKVARYVASLEGELAAARGRDPNSKASMLLQDELRKVTQKREQIYQYRERKLALLSETRKAAFHPAAPTPVAFAQAPAAAQPVASSAAEPPPKGVIVHVLEDVPPFAGPDGTYRLKKEDVVMVHPSIAKVLAERGKARVVNAAP